jgi:hypothetical protein
VPDTSSSAASARRVVVNGIELATGRPARVFTLDELAAAARQRSSIPGAPRARSTTRAFGAPLAPLDDLAALGWAVVFAESTPPAVRQALEPLLARRKQQAGPRYKEFAFTPSDSFMSWLADRQVTPGNRNDDRVPFHLLLVGSPGEIPFAFQYLLDIEYAVGRIQFDAESDYAAYAEAVVRSETSADKLLNREAVFWGTQHDGDDATRLSSSMLLDPLAHGFGGAAPLAPEYGFSVTTCFGPSSPGTRTRLLEALHRPAATRPPAVLFTASHGVDATGDARQRALQGALVSQDWHYGAAIQPEHCVAGADLDDARVLGSVAFCFACFGAGTPRDDNFPKNLDAPPSPIADAPFLSALPCRLLARGALAVIGHVDRAFGYSIDGGTLGPQIGTFTTALRRIFAGAPVGTATADFNSRYAVLAATLLNYRAPYDPTPMSDVDLATAWMERTDAQNYVVLGDPAVRLRAETLA